jgi:hypothetical protein
MEKRRSQRISALNEMKGKLYNVVNFLVENISQDGLSLVSNFQPVIGATYKIYLINTPAACQHDFEITVNRAQVQQYNPEKYAALAPGLLYSIGAVFMNQDDKRKQFLADFLKNKSSAPDQGFISRDHIRSKP